jgi:phage FluMu gp28-like protein
MILGDRAQFLVDNLDLAGASGIPEATWEYFQLLLWSDESMFRIENKSRQIAWSFSAAADAIASMILERRDSIFVSINQDESQEKIRYANSIYENLHISRPGRVRDSLSEIEFSNGVRISSFPSRPVRGRPRSNLYLDEFAHAQMDRAIYTGSLPVLSKGGRLRVGSSPMGASGVFWEIYEERLQRYPGYQRHATPWWAVYSFSTDVRHALALAPSLLTAQRVAQFGNERIQALYANMPEEDFQQEYECLFVDETTAWIPWSEIRAAQDQDLACWSATARASLTPEIMQAIYGLVEAVRRGDVEPAFAAGVDIGRTRNTTEIFLVGLSTVGSYPLRLAITLDAISFDDQLEIILLVLKYLPVYIMLIDQTGLGRNLAENAASRHPIKVQPVDFTNASKLVWATDAKTLIQGGRTPIPVDRELAYQIHSIKKLITASRNLVFDTATNEKHHADKFWAWALALHGAYQRPAVSQTVTVIQEEIVEISPY